VTAARFTFQRRHYEWLAEFCALEMRSGGMTEAAMYRLAARLRDDCPNFNRDRFVDTAIHWRDWGGKPRYAGAIPIAPRGRAEAAQ
jgi:hypothetical protein